MPPKVSVTVAIIGLTRVTASMGLMLKGLSNDPKSSAQFTLIGNDEDTEIAKAAQKMGALDQTKNRILEAVKDAQIVIVDQPLGDLDFVYGAIGDGLRAGAVVLDVSPLKRPVIEFARTHFPKNSEGNPTAYLVGIFPLMHFANLYDFRRGIEAADDKYLIGGDMVITPDANVPPDAVKLATDLTDMLQMKPHFLDPYEFDALSDISEGLPVALSVAMLNVVRAADGRKDLERILNPNFLLLLSHLRAHNPDDMTDMLLNNVDSTRRHLNDLIRALAGLRDLLDKNNPDTLNEHISQSVAEFDDWQNRRDKGIWESSTSTAPSVGSVSMFGNMFGSALERRLTRVESEARQSTRRKRQR